MSSTTDSTASETITIYSYVMTSWGACEFCGEEAYRYFLLALWLCPDCYEDLSRQLKMHLMYLKSKLKGRPIAPPPG